MYTFEKSLLFKYASKTFDLLGEKKHNVIEYGKIDLLVKRELALDSMT